MKAIHANNPATAIVLQTMNMPWSSPKGFMAAATDYPQIENYIEHYRHYATENVLSLVDNYIDWRKLQKTNPAKLQTVIPDGSHPNKNGSLEITWPNIKMLLETARQAKPK